MVCAGCFVPTACLLHAGLPDLANFLLNRRICVTSWLWKSSPYRQVVLFCVWVLLSWTGDGISAGEKSAEKKHQTMSHSVKIRDEVISHIETFSIMNNIYLKNILPTGSEDCLRFRCGTFKCSYVKPKGCFRWFDFFEIRSLC